jgi:hypothetical protein
MQPKSIVAKLAVIAYTNRCLPIPIDIQDLFQIAQSYIGDIKLGGEDKYRLNDIMDVITSINKSAIRYTKEKAISELQLVSDDSIDWGEIFYHVTEDCSDLDSIRQGVISDVAELNNWHTRDNLKNIIGKMYGVVKHNSEKVVNMVDFIADSISQLEKAASALGNDTSADISSVDFSSKESIYDAFEGLFHEGAAGTGYNLGWQDLNIALQGGPRPGDFMMVGSLEHNYKSGFVKTLFRQIAEYNDPPTYPANAVKKPTLYFLSLEEQTPAILMFIYKNIKYNQTGEYVAIDIKGKDKETINKERREIAEFVYDYFAKRGWHIIIEHKNPSELTYRKMLTYLLNLENKGHDVRVMICDYLLKIPTVGCDRSGAAGTDIRDLVSRVRNFMMARQILFITPGQLSPQVKDELIRGTSEHDLLTTIAEKSLYAGSKQIGQVLDISILLKKIKSRETGLTYLDVLIEKHRAPEAIDDKHKHFALVFPADHRLSIPDEVGKPKKVSIKNIPM